MIVRITRVKVGHRQTVIRKPRTLATVFGVFALEFHKIFRAQLDRKRTGNYALPVRSDIWDAGVHVNKVDTCDGEQLRSVEWFGVGTQARWALPL